MITLSRSSASKLAELARIRASAVDGINATTHVTRQKFITSIAGQDLIYLEKEREAVAYVAATRAPADLDDFPFINAEAIATGLAPWQISQIILFRASLWRKIGPEIEVLRIGALSAVDFASGPAELTGILDDFISAMGDL